LAAKKSGLAKRLILLVVVLAAIAAAVVYEIRRRAPQEITLSGALEARTELVGSLSGGRVVRVLVDEGSRVTSGQLIAILQPDTIDRQVDEQRAAIAQANAALAKMTAGSRPEEIAKARATADDDESERRRVLVMYQQGIESKQNYDAAATKAKGSAEDLRLAVEGNRTEDIQAAQAALDQQQRHLATIEQQKTETQIRASVGGLVQSFDLRPGDLVEPDLGVAEILEDGQLWVRVFVPETELALVHVGMTVNVKVDTPNRIFKGVIAQISSQGEYTPQNIQTVDQRAQEVFGVKVLVSPDPALKPGMAATVDLGVKGRVQ
jgi:HlyD family secretion protein